MRVISTSPSRVISTRIVLTGSRESSSPSRNVEKMNKKRARKGLPPANVSEKASVNLKALQAREDAESKAKEDKISRNKKQMEASEAFYNSDPKPGSLASKAKMVQKYNDKHAKK